MISSSFKTLAWSALLLLGSMVYASSSLNIRDMNIMTFIPQESPSFTHNTYGTAAFTQSIHDICKRINRQHDHYINAVISSTSDLTDTDARKIRVISGIPEVLDDVIFIVSSGWSGVTARARYKYHGHGAYTTYLYEKSQIAPGVCVSFDYPTHTRELANFGQTLDQEYLKEVIRRVKLANPHAKIVIVGLCAGAMTALNFISQQPAEELVNIKAVILESPSISIEHIERHVMRKRLGLIRNVVPRFFTAWFSGYDPSGPTIITTAPQIPHSIPLLIGAIDDDKTTSTTGVYRIMNALKLGGHPEAYLFMYHEPLDHSKMGKTEEFPRIVNAFLQSHNLTHNVQLAKEGKPLLRQLFHFKLNSVARTNEAPQPVLY